MSDWDDPDWMKKRTCEYRGLPTEKISDNPHLQCPACGEEGQESVETGYHAISCMNDECRVIHFKERETK